MTKDFIIVRVSCTEVNFNEAQGYLNDAIKNTLSCFRGRLQIDNMKDQTRSEIRLAITETIERFVVLGEVNDSYRVICPVVEVRGMSDEVEGIGDR